MLDSRSHSERISTSTKASKPEIIKQHSSHKGPQKAHGPRLEISTSSPMASVLSSASSVRSVEMHSKSCTLTVSVLIPSLTCSFASIVTNLSFDLHSLPLRLQNRRIRRKLMQFCRWMAWSQSRVHLSRTLRLCL